MVLMDSFYRIIFYPTTYILSPFFTHHIPSCLGSHVDMSQESDMCHDFKITCYSQGWMMSRWFLCAQTTCTEQ